MNYYSDSSLKGGDYSGYTGNSHCGRPEYSEGLQKDACSSNGAGRGLWNLQQLLLYGLYRRKLKNLTKGECPNAFSHSFLGGSDMKVKLVQWDLTGNCNLNCRYCREKRTENLEDLHLKDIFKIIDQFADIKAKMVSVAGGEPLIFRNLPKVLEYMKGKVGGIGLTTNGTLLSKKHIGFIKEYVNGVQVSVDGSTEDVHEFYRGKNTFKKTISALELLVANGIYVVPRFTIGHENRHDVGNYVRLMHKIGLRSAYLRRTIPSGNSRNTKPLSAVELRETFKLAFETGHSLGMHIGSADYFSQICFDPKEREKAEKNLIEKPGQILSGCSIGIEAFYVAQNGQVLFCPYLPVYCGDMTKEHIAEIWKKSEMFEVNRNLRWNKEGKCSGCKFLMCCGGCPAYAFLTTGRITASDGGCWYNNE